MPGAVFMAEEELAPQLSLSCVPTAAELGTASKPNFPPSCSAMLKKLCLLEFCWKCKGVKLALPRGG